MVNTFYLIIMNLERKTNRILEQVNFREAYQLTRIKTSVSSQARKSQLDKLTKQMLFMCHINGEEKEGESVINNKKL